MPAAGHEDMERAMTFPVRMAFVTALALAGVGSLLLVEGWQPYSNSEVVEFEPLGGPEPAGTDTSKAEAEGDGEPDADAGQADTTPPDRQDSDDGEGGRTDENVSDDALVPPQTTEEIEQPADPEEQTEPEAATVLRPGDQGEDVLALQKRLVELGYWLGAPDGGYGELTRQAVLAFQGVESLQRDGIAGPEVAEALADATRPAHFGDDGDRLEIDLAAQVIRVIRNGQTRWTLHTSTGHGGHYDRPGGGVGIAGTPSGTWDILWRIDGIRNAPLGTLYRPAYFHQAGIAIHGAPDVPAYPASSGCARLTNAAMDFMWAQGFVEVGEVVVVR